MIVSISLSKEEEQLFKNYAELSGVDLSTLFKRALLERIELEQDLNTIAEYEKEKANGTLKLYDVEEVVAELGV
ncbi:type II toxin-antitoxin system RelB family antitoxin [Granulicatella sp.]